MRRPAPRRPHNWRLTSRLPLEVDGTACRSKPSWYIVAKNDGSVHAALERFVAKRMGATTYEFESSHVPMLSQPERVIDVIRIATGAVRARSTTA